jgi:hypothetical protein
MWIALSDERTGLSLYMLLALASAIFLGSESLGTHGHILLSHFCDFPFRRLLRQTHPLVRKGAPQKQDRNCQTVINGIDTKTY